MLNGECGIVSLRDRGKRFAALPCQVAAVVPEGSKEEGRWTALQWVSKDVGQRLRSIYLVLIDAKEAHKTAKFAQYGLAATAEALQDAGWQPTRQEDLEATVNNPKPSLYPCADTHAGSLSGIGDRKPRRALRHVGCLRTGSTIEFESALKSVATELLFRTIARSTRSLYHDY